MTNAKNTQTENPNMYYAIILLATGLVIYKWFNEVDKTLIINTLIQLGIAILVVLWFVAIIFFYIRGDVLEKQKSKVTAKILIHITNFMIIILFVYRFMRPHVVSIFFIIHGLIALFLFMYYNYIIPKTVVRLRSEYDDRKHKVLVDENEIYRFIHANLDTLSVDELKRKREYFRDKKYSDKVLSESLAEFRFKLQELNYQIEKKYLESEICRIRTTRYVEQTKLDNIQKAKDEILMDENSKKAEKEYNLTHREENVILCQRLTKEEKTILRKAKHKQVNEYCAHQKKILTVFVRPVMGHSATHTFLV